MAHSKSHKKHLKKKKDKYKGSCVSPRMPFYCPIEYVIDANKL